MAHDFKGVLDHDECVGIQFTDVVLEPMQLPKADHRIESSLLFSAVAALPMKHRQTPPELSKDLPGNFLPLSGIGLKFHL